jgi:hypothetical protein
MRASTNLRAAAAGTVAAVLLAVPGCSGRHDYARVEGRVTLDRKPLAGVMVAFYPDTEGDRQPPYSTATTDESGHYTLTSSAGVSGALVGRHRVVVHWPLPERNPDGTPAKPPGPPIPLRYTVALDTPLLIDVKPDGPQTIDLPLTSP